MNPDDLKKGGVWQTGTTQRYEVTVIRNGQIGYHTVSGTSHHDAQSNYDGLVDRVVRSRLL